MKNCCLILVTENIVMEYISDESCFTEMGFTVKDLLMITAYSVAESMYTCTSISTSLKELLEQELITYPGCCNEDLQWLLDICEIIAIEMVPQMRLLENSPFEDFMADTWIGNNLVLTFKQ